MSRVNIPTTEIRNERRDYEDQDLVAAYYDMQPEYPDAVRKKILGCLAAGVGRKLMVDVGCGGGKSTKPFVQDFEHIIGIDISQSQIELARRKSSASNVEFQVVHDNILPVASNTAAYLVFCGISFQYLEPSVFLPECDRALVYGGIMACVVYGPNILRTLAGKLICDYSAKGSRWAQLQKEYMMNCGTDEGVREAYLTRHEDTFNSIKNPTKRYVHLADFDRKFTVKELLRLCSTTVGYSRKTYADEKKDPLNILRRGPAGIFRDAGLDFEDDTEFAVTFEFSAIIVEKTKSFGIA